jgi:hypothetical protein
MKDGGHSRPARTQERIAASFIWPLLCAVGWKKGWITIGKPPARFEQWPDKQWRGHRVRTETELQAMDCPFPAEEFETSTKLKADAKIFSSYYERDQDDLQDNCSCEVLVLPTATNITNFGNCIRDDGIGINWRIVYCHICGGQQYSEKRAGTER